MTTTNLVNTLEVGQPCLWNNQPCIITEVREDGICQIELADGTTKLVGSAYLRPGVYHPGIITPSPVGQSSPEAVSLVGDAPVVPTPHQPVTQEQERVHCPVPGCVYTTPRRISAHLAVAHPGYAKRGKAIRGNAEDSNSISSGDFPDRKKSVDMDKTRNQIPEHPSYPQNFPATENRSVLPYTRSAIRIALASAAQMSVMTDQPLIKAYYEGYTVGFTAALAIICGVAGIDLAFLEGESNDN